MVKKPDKNLIVGLDIGTSKIVTLVGELTADNTVNIVGVGSHPSRGLKRGVVVNIESTVQSIQRAVEEAELIALFKQKVEDAPAMEGWEPNKLDKWALPPPARAWFPDKGDLTQLDKWALPPVAGKRRDANDKWI